MAEVKSSRNVQYRPDKINGRVFLNLLENPNHTLFPINLGIPNLTIPNNMVPRQFGNTESSIKLKVRELLNIVTKDSIIGTANKLRSVIDEETRERGKLANSSILKDIANEFLDTFLVSGKQLNEHLQLLNSIYMIAIKEPSTQVSDAKPILSKSIGGFITDLLKEKYMSLVSESNVKAMAMRDVDNPDEQDLYYREEDKLINIISLICAMYNQRNTKNISLHSTHIIIILNKLLTSHANIIKNLKNLENNDDESENEEEYDIYRRMATIYEKCMYTVFKDYHKDMVNDKDPLVKKDVDGNIIQTVLLKDLINMFKKNVIPHICEMYLISLVKSLNI